MIVQVRQWLPALRTTAVCAVSLLVVPFQLVNACVLLWFLPELTWWGTPGNEGHQYLWLVVFVLTAAAAACLILAWFRRHHSARWWLWLLTAPLLIVVSLPVMNRL